MDNFFDSKSFQDFIELTWFKIEYTQLSSLASTKTELTEFFVDQLSNIVKEAQFVGSIRKDIHARDVSLTITHLINGMYRLFFVMPSQNKKKEQAMRPFVSYLELIKTSTYKGDTNC